jgi:hypothetical protein
VVFGRRFHTSRIKCYTIPNYALARSASQRDDGLIEAFGARIQFGLATFDIEYTYRGAPDIIARMDFDFARSEGVDGLFSYAGGTQNAPRQRLDGTTVGRAFFPGCTFPLFIDTGIRSAGAPEGALLLPSREDSPSIRSQQLREQLRRARPFGGTPTDAALDDLYFYFTEDPAGPGTSPSRKRHVVLITDGRPDSAFRALGCACKTEEECGGDPSQMSCPYPTATEAALHLRCGFDASACAGPIDALHVVGLSVVEDYKSELDAIAAAGGADRARYANSQPELRAALREVFEDILSR